MRAEKSHINVHFSQHLDPALNIRRLNISLEQFKTQYPSAQIQGPYLKKSNPSLRGQIPACRQISWTCVDKIFRWPADRQKCQRH